MLYYDGMETELDTKAKTQALVYTGIAVGLTVAVIGFFIFLFTRPT